MTFQVDHWRSVKVTIITVRWRKIGCQLAKGPSKMVLVVFFFRSALSILPLKKIFCQLAELHELVRVPFSKYNYHKFMFDLNSDLCSGIVYRYVVLSGRCF